MWTSEEDVRVAMREAIRRSAQTAGLPDAETASADSLLPRIQARGAALYEALRAFLTSLDAWYQTHLAIEKAGHQGNLSAAEATLLGRQIDEKNSAAEHLADLVRE